MSEVLSFPKRETLPLAIGPSPMPLELRHLAFQADSIAILMGIDLKLDTDALTVLMGPNGAGKSVFLRLLHGLIKPTFGEVLWNGEPACAATRKQQALVFQKPVLLRRSVKANLSFALGLRPFQNRKQRLQSALDSAGLADLADRPAHVLSGGEQQRLALARALILEPKVLFLDEPTANLDPASTLLIEQTIQRVRQQGVKVILVTHDTHQARRLAEDVLFMHRGRLIEHSSAQTFFDRPAMREARAYLDGEILV
ncbi:tungstate transport system ATP-binding protein [Roseibium hamelinense]|uniref:Tungstate transport system ATP-binding protein n=1 Tax=Roseibium hamelinense TaxID=150831 RepID=A0A562TIG7_9HYPH|nr:ATP-binding cassette domain-containing protein [Roseibium hamelinense]MTI46121.1 ATP-binding cassette domain-containing protein [Roseibium hamelinense]TWI92686.1 tungstate transport system ATP-binding protein [Roseibium hamelinense]